MESVISSSAYSQLCLTGFDADALLGVVNGTRFEQRLLSGGLFHAQLQRLQFARCSLDCGAYTLPVFAQGGFGPEVMAIALAVQSSQPMWANGQEVACGRLMVFAEDHPLDVRSLPGHWQWCVLLLKRELLMETTLHRHGIEPLLPNSGWRLLAPATAVNARLCTAILRVLEQASRWTGATPTSVVRATEGQVLGMFIDAMVEGMQPTPMARGDARVRQRELLARADMVMNERMGEDLDLAAWCAAIGIGGRQMERLFLQAHGVGPCRWYKLARLNEARRRLSVQQANISVTEVALAMGFTHLGRFSGEYRALFGESPMQTLAAARERHWACRVQ